MLPRVGVKVPVDQIRDHRIDEMHLVRCEPKCTAAAGRTADYRKYCFAPEHGQFLFVHYGAHHRIALRRFAYPHAQRFMRLILFPAKQVVYLRPLLEQLDGDTKRVRRWIAAARTLGNRWGFGPRHGFRWYSPDERTPIPAWVRRRVHEL
jgi:hypothetical protein